MPVTKQAIKKVRQDKRKTAFNLRIKKTYKETIKKFLNAPTAAELKSVYRALDRAAKTNVIHKNKAARLKSRLSKKVPDRKSSTRKKSVSK